MNRRRALKYLGIVGGTAAAGTLAISSYHQSVKASQRSSILIAGAANMESYLQRIAKAYNASHPNIDIVIEKGHARAGLLALQRGGVDIAMMDRDLTLNESTLNVCNILIGIDGIALIVHPDCPLASLTTKQARKIFQGKLTNWQELGGPEAKITPYTRSFDSTTRISLDELLMQGTSVSRQIKEVESAQDMLKKVANDRFAVGYVSIRYLNENVRAIKLNDVEVNEQTLLLKRYPLTKDMLLAITNDCSAVAKQFINFVTSGNGQKIIADNGLLRVR